MTQSTTSLPHRSGKRSFLRSWIWPLLLGGTALTLALITRYVWIESTEIGLTCSAVPPPWWCEARYAVIRVHQEDGWGLTALAAGVVALIARWRPVALLALVAGLIGLVLYNTGLAAVGLLAGSLSLLRR